jgi:hypothetical protein
MSREFPELDVFKVSVDEQTRDQHLSVISNAIHKPQRTRGRHRLLAVAIAAVLLVPVMAFAAERSLPGDFLYQFKRSVVEPVVSVVDGDVAAYNRVEEVENLFAHEASIDAIRDHVVVARDAAVDSPDLIERIEHVEREVDKRESDAAHHPPPDRDRSTPTTTEPTETDRPTTTRPPIDTTTPGDRTDGGDG